MMDEHEMNNDDSFISTEADLEMINRWSHWS